MISTLSRAKKTHVALGRGLTHRDAAGNEKPWRQPRIARLRHAETPRNADAVRSAAGRSHPIDARVRA
jgi:hypothetical protein